MQTFLPYGRDFSRTAHALDYRRLGKQRVETWQILQTLLGNSKGWANHPAVKMWEGHEVVLCVYGLVMCYEWKHRGYKDNMAPRFRSLITQVYETNPNTKYPEWIDNEDIVTSHQSNLVRKFADHYRKFWPDVPDDLPYIWPVTNK